MSSHKTDAFVTMVVGVDQLCVWSAVRVGYTHFNVHSLINDKTFCVPLSVIVFIPVWTHPDASSGLYFKSSFVDILYATVRQWTVPFVLTVYTPMLNFFTIPINPNPFTLDVWCS